MKLGWMQGSGEDIVAFRGERGSYNPSGGGAPPDGLSRLPAAVFKGYKSATAFHTVLTSGK